VADAVRRAAFADGEVPVAVYGLGRTGLPLAAACAEVGGNVVGADADRAVVDTVRRGECPFDDEPGLPEAVAAAVEAGSLRATTDIAAAAEAATLHAVAVPAPLDDGQPDRSGVRAVIERVGAALTPGETVLVGSTLPPGTCRDVIEPALERESGLGAGEFGLACCPVRATAGRALREIRETTAVVGGTDAESRRVAELIAGELTTGEVVTVADPTTAECAAVFEDVYREVNTALANELAGLAGEFGVDVRAAIRAANTGNRCDIHDPGAGDNGTPSSALLHGCGSAMPLVREARAVNAGMATATVDRLARELGARGTDLDRATVALLGVTDRPGVDETRASPAVDVAARLREARAEVYAVDPVCSDMSVVDAVPVDVERLSALEPDAVVLLTGHDAFRTLPWDCLPETLVLDTRNALDDAGPHRLVTLGDGRTYSG
jgi:UDP-N-acetyl-D-mannosaminuronic acid dehydrogenase